MSNLMTLLESFKTASDPVEQASIAEKIKLLTTPPPAVATIKETKVQWKDGRLSFTVGRSNAEYAFQHLAELSCATGSLQCIAWHLNGERNEVEHKFKARFNKEAADAEGNITEKHTYLGKMDCKDDTIAGQMQARFDAACDAILAAANWVEDMRSAEVAAESVATESVAA